MSRDRFLLSLLFLNISFLFFLLFLLSLLHTSILSPTFPRLLIPFAIDHHFPSFASHLSCSTCLTFLTFTLPLHQSASSVPFCHRTTSGRRRFTARPSTDTRRWSPCCCRSWPTPPWGTASRRRLWTWRRCTDACRSAEVLLMEFNEEFYMFYAAEARRLNIFIILKDWRVHLELKAHNLVCIGWDSEL